MKWYFWLIIIGSAIFLTVLIDNNTGKNLQKALGIAKTKTKAPKDGTNSGSNETNGNPGSNGDQPNVPKDPLDAYLTRPL